MLRRKSSSASSISKAAIEALESRQLLSGVIFQTSNSVTTSDNNGPIIASPHVILVFWGGNWGNGTATPAAGTVQSNVSRMLSPFYLPDLSSYRSGFGNGYIDRTVTITSSSPPASFAGTNVASMLQTNINNGTLPRPNTDSNYLYLVVAQNGTSSPGANGAHSVASDNQSNKFHYGWTTNNGNIDFVSNVLSHEIVEAMTDAEGDAIQVNPRNSSSWNEVSDTTAQNFSGWFQGVQMQSYWLQSRKAYILPFGNMDIDATAGAGGQIVVNGDQQGVTSDTFIVNKDASGRIEITINNQTISLAKGNSTGQYQSVKFVGREGADSLSISATVDFPVAFDGGNGYDTVYFMGTQGADNIVFNTNKPQGSTFDVFNSNPEQYGISSLGGNDNITVNDSNRDLSLIGGDGFNQYFLNSFTSGHFLSCFGGSNADWFYLTNSSANVANVSNISSLNFYGNGGDDRYDVWNQAAPGNWTYTANNASVSVQSAAGYSLTAHVDLGATVLFRGGAGNDNFYANPGAAYVFYCYGNDGADTFDMRDGYSAQLFGGNQDDNFIFGGGNLGPSISSIIADGGNGSDKMTLDDHLSTHNYPWAVFGNTGDPNTQNTVFLLLNAYTYNGFEGVEVLGGNGSNDFQIKSSSVPVTLRGGGGDDSFRFLQTDATIIDVTVDGQSGFNTMTADDRNYVFGMTVMQLYDNVMRRWAGIVPNTSFYSNIQSVTYYADPHATTTYIYGTSASVPFGQQYSLFLGSGTDTVIMEPIDSAGNMTIQGAIGINGGGGTDAFYVNNGNTSRALGYQLANPFGPGTQGIYGMGPAGVGTAGIESITINAGSGNDSFSVDQYTSGVALRLNGGNGDDGCYIGNGDLSANITSIAAFTFDGQNGADGFVVSNSLTTTAWNYETGNGFVDAYRQSNGYFIHMVTPNIEGQYMVAGSAGDAFYIDALASGVYTELDGNGGIDGLGLGYFDNTLENVHAPVYYYGGAQGGNMLVSDTTDTTGDTVHLDANSMGAYAGDNLFGAGGSLHFYDLANFGVYPGITLNLGSGADNVYAKPSATANITINANNPTTSPGDSLNLATAGLSAPVVHGTPASGNLTSASTLQLTWTGFEGSVLSDAVSPAVLGGQINLDGQPGGGGASKAPGRVQTLDVRFTENVSGLLSPSSIQLTNLTTGQMVPTANIAVQYNVLTNTASFSFPGYPNGVLPDGNYRGKIFAGLTDYFGNPLPSDATFDFFFLAGDANHDRVVNVTDLGVLATNWQGTNKLFSQGDFNYDGVVNVTDLGILATKWQQSLPATGAPAVRQTGVKSMPFNKAVSLVGLDDEVSELPTLSPQLVNAGTAVLE